VRFGIALSMFSLLPHPFNTVFRAELYTSQHPYEFNLNASPL